MRVIIDGHKSHENNYTGRTDIEFISCEEDECDIFIAIDLIETNKPIKTVCRDGGFWIIPYEPPVECYRYFTEGYKYFDLVYTQATDLDPEVENKVIRERYPLMPLTDLTHKEVVNLVDGFDVTGKKDRVSAIISSAESLNGHKLRTDFMNFLTEKEYDFDRYGKGVNWIPQKADALLPYKYSIGMENSAFLFYCTEKIADCFACLTMPVYWGCPNIIEYFPEESMILINENDFEGSLEKIEAAVRNDYYTKNFDALVYAREKLLQEYTLYPYICRLIDNYYKPTSAPKPHYYPGRLSPKERKLSYKVKKSLGVYKFKQYLRNRKLYKVKD